MRRKKGKHGFTLLELIIVVIVIGILASIALPRYIRIAEKGRVAEAKSVLGALRSAQLRYAAQWATYTDIETTLDLNINLSTKYYNYTTSLNSSVESDATQLAQAVRKTGAGTDNPGLGAYTINITAGGNLTCNDSTLL